MYDIPSKDQSSESKLNPSRVSEARLSYLNDQVPEASRAQEIKRTKTRKPNPDPGNF